MGYFDKTESKEKTENFNDGIEEFHHACQEIIAFAAKKTAQINAENMKVEQKLKQRLAQPEKHPPEYYYELDEHFVYETSRLRAGHLADSPGARLRVPLLYIDSVRVENVGSGPEVTVDISHSDNRDDLYEFAKKLSEGKSFNWTELTAIVRGTIPARKSLRETETEIRITTISGNSITLDIPVAHADAVLSAIHLAWKRAVSGK